MSNDSFENKIIRLARSGPDMGRIQGLESRVWQAIQVRKADMPRNIIEGWLASIFVPEYRFASMTVAMMIGVFVASLSIWPTQPANAAVALNLHVFASDYASPLSKIVENRGDKI